MLTPWWQAPRLTTTGSRCLLAHHGGGGLLRAACADRAAHEAQRALQAQARGRGKLSLWARWPVVWHTTSTTCSRASSASARWRRTPRRRAATRPAISTRCCRRRCAARPWSSASSRSAAAAPRASTVFELEPVVEEVLHPAVGLVASGHRARARARSAGARLRGDPTQAFEAVMNLCTNAMQAMPDGRHAERAAARERTWRTPRVLSHSRARAGRLRDADGVATRATASRPP